MAPATVAASPSVPDKVPDEQLSRQQLEETTFYLLLIPEDADAELFTLHGLTELLATLRSIIQDSTKNAEQAKYPLATTAVRVFSEQWSITKLPLSYLVSPDQKQRYALSNMDVDMSRINADGYLVDRPDYEEDVPQNPETEAEDMDGGSDDTAAAASHFAPTWAEVTNVDAERAVPINEAVELAAEEDVVADMFADEPT